MTKLNWGIIGTGVIGKEMGQILNNLHGEIYAVSDIDYSNAKEYGRTFNVQNVYKDSSEMILDPNVDIIYIAIPHNLHFEYALKALKAGKHVFCEKSITVNSEQLEVLTKLAKEKNLIVMEGMTIYHMPLYKKLNEIIESGAIGKVKMIQVNFGSCKEYDVNNRFFNKNLAGGALLDIGVYAASFARFFMTTRPNTILSTVSYFETGVDEQSGIILKNDNKEMAVIALTMRAKQPKRGIIAGELGYIEVNNYPRAEEATITYTETGKTEKIILGETEKALEYEAKDIENYILFDSKEREQQVTLSLDVSYILNTIRNIWGFRYPFEDK